MRRPSLHHVAFRAIFGLVLFVLLCRPAVARASERPDELSGPVISTGQSRGTPAQGTPDFLFGRPRGSVGIRSGWMFARAGSDLFTFVRDRLTINRKDFNAPALAADLGIVVAPRTEAVFGFDFTRSSTASEYRAFVDNNRLPIKQDTRLQHLTLSGSVKFALLPRGREVSRYAWVPRTVTPYAGAGGGALWYELRQEGDFVDFTNFRVFGDTFRSRGWTPSAHVFGGVDVKLWRRLYFTSEARYLWSHAALGRDFSGFQPIDLAGFKMTAGISGVF